MTYTALGRHDDALAMEKRCEEFSVRVFVSMGFDEDLVHRALANAEGNPHQAMELLISAKFTVGNAAHCMQETCQIVLTRHRGSGFATIDGRLYFHEFNTFVADVKLCGGCFYWEVQVLDLDIASGGALVACDTLHVQFGCCTDGFESHDDPGGEGAGDDASSWAVCGHRQEKWHAAMNSAFGSKWSVGVVIGFALDLRSAGSAVMSVSVNGSFAPPNGVVFSGIDAPYLSPALTGYGHYRVNFGDLPFAHAPPCSEFIYVHDFWQDEDDDDLRLAKLLSVSIRDCSVVGGAAVP